MTAEYVLGLTFNIISPFSSDICPLSDDMCWICEGWQPTWESCKYTMAHVLTHWQTQKHGHSQFMYMSKYFGVDFVIYVENMIGHIAAGYMYTCIQPRIQPCLSDFITRTSTLYSPWYLSSLETPFIISSITRQRFPSFNQADSLMECDLCKLCAEFRSWLVLGRTLFYTVDNTICAESSAWLRNCK